MKKRLDILLVEKGLCETRAKARGLILAGDVYVDGKRVDKAGHLIDSDAKIEIKSSLPEYVSRGGLKLAHALKEFELDVNDFVCVDIGASTGGFTDCLLKNGAKKVYSIDVGYGQLDWSLRNDKRIVVIEKTNIKDFDLKMLEESIDLVVIDVSFIGLEKVFPKVDGICSKHIIALIKPQFQVGREKVGKGGVVRDDSVRQEAIDIVNNAAKSLGWNLQGVTESPIKGPKGNIEYLAYYSPSCYKK